MIIDLGWDRKFIAGARIFSVGAHKMAFLILPLFNYLFDNSPFH